MNFFRKNKLNETKAIILTVVFLLVIDNWSFFNNVWSIYPLSFENFIFITSLGVVIGCLLIILLSLSCFRFTFKPILITFLIASSLIHYFMDSYNIVVDAGMIQNVVQTNAAEARDLMTGKLVAFLLFFGILPATIVYAVKLEKRPLKLELLARVKLIGFSLLAIILILFGLGRNYASFLREHKPLRCYVNPIFPLYSLGKYLGSQVRSKSREVQALGEDAAIPETDIDRELIFLIIGETARADHFSLNGYPVETNPLLQNEDVVSFKRMYSCATSTAKSVPCMFSLYGRDTYDGHATENILDILQRAGVSILWRDNNSDSKGVAERIEYQDFKDPEVNPECDVECRDIGMLAGLESYIQSRETGDILIVLHQMGSHGPAYYKRYPEEFKVFQPVCETSQLERCSDEEIVNAYDNTIRYTDYFLHSVIQLLKQYDDQFEVGMIYLSDHGESLGEHGVYLHGLPYPFAPENQKHVASVVWLGQFLKLDYPRLKEKEDNEYSHDNLFHSLLGIFEVETELYQPELDLFR